MKYVLIELVEEKRGFKFFTKDVPFDREKVSPRPVGTAGKVFIYWPETKTLEEGKEVLKKYIKKIAAERFLNAEKLVKKVNKL